MIPQAQQSSDVLVLQVTVNLDEAQGSGVAWLEAECNGFMSPALPIVLCEDPDIVEELRSLEAEIADGRCAAVSLHPVIGLGEFWL